MRDIEEIALLGYQFAESGCKGIPPLNYKDEMELMAFNAGISNFNARNGTNHTRYKPTSSTLTKSELAKNRYPSNHMAVQQSSI